MGNILIYFCIINDADFISSVVFEIIVIHTDLCVEEFLCVTCHYGSYKLISIRFKETPETSIFAFNLGYV